MAVSYVNFSKSTSNQESKVLSENNSHQITLEAFESSSPETTLNPSSGVVDLYYRPHGSTAYILGTTIDLSSGAKLATWGGIFTGVRLINTHGSSSLIKGDYIGWKS